MENTYIVYGVSGLALAVAWWFITREPTTQKAQLKSSLGKDTAAIVRMKDVWILIGLLLCAMGSYDTVCYWLPSILELKGVPSVTAGLVSDPAIPPAVIMIAIVAEMTLILGFVIKETDKRAVIHQNESCPFPLGTSDDATVLYRRLRVAYIGSLLFPH